MPDTEADPVAAALEKIAERDRRIWDRRGNGNGPLLLAITEAEYDVPRALAALEDVLELHVPEQHAGDQDSWCAGCAIDLSDEDEEPFSSGSWRGWPCPTYTAISRALLGEEAGDVQAH